MKIYVSDLLKVGWLKDILESNVLAGMTFAALKENYFFVFFYDTVTDKSTIDVKYVTSMPVINDLIYKTGAEKGTSYTGVLKQPFDTNNMLLYMFLRGMILKSTSDSSVEYHYKLLDDLFLSYKNEDLKRVQKPTEIGIYDIVIEANMEDALNHFMLDKKVVNPLLDITRTINSYIKKSTKKNLIGQCIRQVVNAISNPNGGLIPQEQGRMRYLIIGELAAQNDPKLAEAKSLLRSKMPLNHIFMTTGWFFSPLDGKWRKKLSDKNLKFKTENLTKVVPDGFLSEFNILNPRSFETNNDIVQTGFGGELIIELLKKGYDVKIGDIIDNEELFKYYPSLYYLPLVYVEEVKSFSSGVNEGVNAYYSDSIPKHINIAANSAYEPLQIILHEMQHFIQRSEGFGNGGNDTFARILTAVGGKEFRYFRNGLDKYSKEFCDKLTLESFTKLQDLLSTLGRDIGKYVVDFKQAQDNCTDIFFSLLNTYITLSKPRVITADDLALLEKIIAYVTENISGGCALYFYDMGRQTDEVAKQQELLTKQGWSGESISQLYYNVYRWLLGEQEARYVQQTKDIPQELNEYFIPNSNEYFDSSKVNVIGVEDLSDAPKNPKAGIESFADGTYILHLSKSYDAEGYLHELGHIIYDCIEKDTKYYQWWFKAYQNKFGFSDLEELFCTYFVEYWMGKSKKSSINPALYENFARARKADKRVTGDIWLTGTEMNEMFDELFFTDVMVTDKDTVKRYLEFVNLLNATQSNVIPADSIVNEQAA